MGGMFVAIFVVYQGVFFSPFLMLNFLKNPFSEVLLWCIYTQISYLFICLGSLELHKSVAWYLLSVWGNFQPLSLEIFLLSHFSLSSYLGLILHVHQIISHSLYLLSSLVCFLSSCFPLLYSRYIVLTYLPFHELSLQLYFICS